MRKAPTKFYRAETTTAIPAAFTREIGKIMVKWAFLEYQLQAYVWEIAGVDDRIGRLAMREPRAYERLEMIRDIAALRDVDLDSANVIAFIRAISDRRDLFAHGIWAKAPDGGWRVILMRGNHPKDSDVPHRSRKINPEGVTVTADSLKRLVGQIEEVTEIFRTMRNQLRAQLKASAEIRQSQFGPVRRSRVPNLNKR